MAHPTVEVLRRLIAFDTHNPGGNEPALAAVLAGELRARGADEVEMVHVPRPPGDARPGGGAYVFARWGTPRFLIDAHLDTVPPNAGWAANPFLARVEEDRVIGLGAADTKGAIAAVLVALERRTPRDLAVLFSGDEERGGTCVRAFLHSPQAKGIERAIACEPTMLHAGVRHRGVICLEATASGDGGHSSGADRMKNPIAELARVAVAWDDWGRARRDQGPPGFVGSCFHVAKLDGGVAFNVVTERAQLSASLRPAPGADQPALERELTALAERTSPGVKVEVALSNAPFATRDLGSFRPWLGGTCDLPVDLGFWTEAAVLSAAGIDAVVFGPGDIAQAHAPEEWVAISQLHLATGGFQLLFEATQAENNGAG